MSPTSRPRTAAHARPSRTDLGSHLAASLTRSGFAIVDDLFGDEVARKLRAEAEALHARGAFVPARIGHAAQRKLAPDVRRDTICWLDPAAPGHARDGARGVRPPATLRALLRAVEVLRGELNRELYLGLRRVECHLARYDAGAFYRAHTDAFVGSAARVVSFVYFLNPAWVPADGGVLRLCREPPVDIEPRLDRMAVFLSREVLHEVTRVERPRWTVTGWMATDDR